MPEVIGLQEDLAITISFLKWQNRYADALALIERALRLGASEGHVRKMSSAWRSGCAGH
jgi:hypothetical protein